MKKDLKQHPLSPKEQLARAAAEHMTPQPKKPSVYQAMGPRDEPSQYETMQLGDQPIYEETF